MKAQSTANTILFILIAIFGALILFYGIKNIGSIKGKAHDLEINNFVSSIQSMIDEVNNYGIGSSRDFSYILPENIEKICFNDGSEINELVDSDFNNINKYYNDNLYLFPGYSFKLEGLSLEETPVCFEVGEKIDLLFIKRKNGVGFNVSNKKMECTAVIYNGNEENKMDFVFLADNYKDLQDFKDDVNKYIQYGFEVVEPFKSNMEKMNFYLINEFKDLGCEDISNNIICDSSKVKETAIRCPNDYIIVLSKNKITSPLRSTVYNGIAAINTADNKLVIIHELGHLIGSLADEYIVHGLSTVDGPNCDLFPCNKWKDKDKDNGKEKYKDKGCYSGCSLKSHHRATEDSIMRAFGFGHDNEFGFYSEGIMLENFEVYE